MGKYFPEVFLKTERRRSKFCAKKTKANSFQYTDRDFYYIWLLVHFFSLVVALCSS